MVLTPHSIRVENSLDSEPAFSGLTSTTANWHQRCGVCGTPKNEVKAGYKAFVTDVYVKKSMGK
jgi:hypothetical protein